eukprot:CFRG1197T1
MRICAMDGVVEFTVLFLEGVADAVAVPKVFDVIDRSDRAFSKVGKCLLMNSVLFIGCLHLFNGYVVSMLMFVVKTMYDVLGIEQGDQQAAVTEAVFNLAYCIIWVYPVYSVSFIINAIWYQDIAEDAYIILQGQRHVRKKHPSQRSVLASISTKIAENIVSLLLEMVVAIQVLVLHFIPCIGPFLSFVLMSWLYSLYCFEFKWACFGWSLDKRLSFIERRWPYFLGFGLPLSCATFFSTKFLSSGLFAILYPPFLIMATGTDLETRRTLVQEPPRIPIFAVAKSVNKYIFLVLGHTIKPSPMPNKQAISNEKLGSLK